tara:strand:- start:5197 stop:5430 length:234 start_codon:yes stop_codon:yes gene_type:complete
MDTNSNQELILLSTHPDFYIIDPNTLIEILDKVSINSLMILFLGACFLSVLCSIKTDKRRHYIAVASEEPTVKGTIV